MPTRYEPVRGSASTTEPDTVAMKDRVRNAYRDSGDAGYAADKARERGDTAMARQLDAQARSSYNTWSATGDSLAAIRKKS